MRIEPVIARQTITEGIQVGDSRLSRMARPAALRESGGSAVALNDGEIL